jgi:uncharacterized protein (TIGR03437 family)
MAWNATVTGAWVQVTPSQGVLPGLVPFEAAALSVSVNSAGLPAGVYYGTIGIRAPGDAQSAPADNSPQFIEVALTIGGAGPAPGIGVSPSSLSFEGVTGGGRAGAVNLQITNTGAGTLNWSARTETSSGGGWLSATPLSGSALNVTASTAGLAAGSYSGRVVITAAGAANSPLGVPVSLRVRDPAAPALRVSEPSLLFSVQDVNRPPPAQRLEISNAGEGALNWRADVLAFNGGPWLSASPRSGSGAGTLTVTVDLAGLGLGPGSYAGRITITADGAQGSPMQIPVTLAIQRPQPELENRGVVNAASLVPGFLAPGELISLFGARLGPREGTVFALDPETRRVPASLGGTQVFFDGYAAPLLYVSYGQVNLQVPFELAGRASTRMVVSPLGLDPVEMVLPMREASPGVFTTDGVRAAALNQNGSLNVPQNPAERGSIVQLFLTGQGVLDPPLPTGALAPLEPPFPAPLLPVRVTMNGIDARVVFAGAAPGFAGLMQLNVETPASLQPSNEVNVAVLIGTHPAGRVTLAVR